MCGSDLTAHAHAHHSIEQVVQKDWTPAGEKPILTAPVCPVSHTAQAAIRRHVALDKPVTSSSELLLPREQLGE